MTREKTVHRVQMTETKKTIVWPELTHNTNGTDGLKKWESTTWKHLDLTPICNF